MRQWKFKGFTLIELLIVVAIIAILAAIAVPNFLEAQIRSKVSRSKNDMRSIATALEAYFVDNNTYVAHSTGTDNKPRTVNSGLKKPATAKADDAAPCPANAYYRYAMQTYRPSANDGKDQTLTTPVAFMSSLPNDPFADSKGSTFGYYNALDAGWIMWSYGPDTDENGTGAQANGEIQEALWAKNITGTQNTQSVYNPYMTNPTVDLLNISYDSTNGSTSQGDIFRVKQ